MVIWPVSTNSRAVLERLPPQSSAAMRTCGFQKIFRAPSGRRTPALAEHLQALHAFREDLAQALGLTSLYNEGLGSTNESHLYDRVQDRDSGPRPRPWERS